MPSSKTRIITLIDTGLPLAYPNFQATTHKQSRWRKASGSQVELCDFDIAEDAVDDVHRPEADPFIPEDLSDRGTALRQLMSQLLLPRRV
jgi:hypothetical protein